MMNKMAKSWGGLLAALRWSSALVLAFMMLSICYDAAMRYLFSAPTSWSLEINSFLIVYLAVIGAAEAQHHDAHIRITFFSQMLPPTFRNLLGCLIALAGVVFSGIMAWRGWLMAFQSFEYSERVSSAFGTPMVFPYGLLPVGFAALGMQFLISAYRAVVPGQENAKLSHKVME